jgi:hypothetical protein
VPLIGEVVPEGNAHPAELRVRCLASVRLKRGRCSTKARRQDKRGNIEVTGRQCSRSVTVLSYITSGALHI